MSDRPTASTITDPQLDELFSERDQLAAVLREVLAAFSTTARDEPGGRILGYLAVSPIHPDDMARWQAALNPTKEQP